MKNIVICFLFFISFNSYALVNIPECRAENLLDNTYSFKQAIPLIQKVQFFGNHSDFSKRNWKSYTELLKIHKSHVEDIEIVVYKPCDFLTMQASQDKWLRPYLDSEFKSFRISLISYSDQAVRDTPIGRGGVHHVANLDFAIFYNVRIITKRSCIKLIDCFDEVLQVYPISIELTTMAMYQTGGISSAGGGSSKNNKNFSKFIIDGEQFEVKLPGFYDALNKYSDDSIYSFEMELPHTSSGQLPKSEGPFYERPQANWESAVRALRGY